ncbi:MAG: hypothetical protein H6737_18060 [Alphaproteobacteria bacterium]|nr:hypothetical protein [Alphaproteobacteria bacterium]
MVMARRLTDRFDAPINGFRAFEPDVDERLRPFVHLPRGWNGYAAPPPNRRALGLASRALAVLDPSRIRPDAEGGIGLYFGGEARFVHLCIDNEGDAAAAFVDDATGELRSEDIDLDELDALKRRIEAWLRG